MSISKKKEEDKVDNKKSTKKDIKDSTSKSPSKDSKSEISKSSIKENSKNDILNDDKDHNKTSENSKSKPSVSSTIKIENKDDSVKESNPYILLKKKKETLRLHGQPFSKWPPRIHVATNLKLAKYIFRLKELSYGLVQVDVTDRSGKVLNSLESIEGVREHTLFSDFLRKSVNL